MPPCLITLVSVERNDYCIKQFNGFKSKVEMLINGGNMDILVMISIASTMFLVGFFVGQAQKVAELKTTQKSYEQGLMEGAQITLELVDKHMKGGLTSVLDWETAQRLLREQMSRN